MVKKNINKNNEITKNTNKNKKKKRNILKTIKGKLKKKKYTQKELIVVIMSSLVIGFIMCFSFMSLVTKKNYISVVKDLRKFIDTYYTITDDFYGKIDNNTLIDGAIEGMISSVGDNFTNYTDINDTQSFNESINGTYEGIGCSIATYSDGRIVVIDVFNGSPSHKAGLKSGDIVIKVDGESLEGKTGSELSNYVKNNAKDKVTLTIVRDDNEMDITINLSEVEIPSVNGEVIKNDNQNIGYINISLFANNTYKQFKSKLEELEQKNIDGLIIDVRNNSGGYLKSVTDICSLFLEKGKIIYQLEDSKGVTKKKDKTKEKREYGVVVIINGASASASEILATAINESYGGFTVGTKSYGKGTVQETKKLLDGSMIKYTSQKWLTPLGNSIDGIGITPTNYVELNSDYFDNPNIDTDNQIIEAIKLLKK